MIDKVLNKIAHIISTFTIPPIFCFILFAILGTNIEIINKHVYYSIIFSFGLLLHIIWVVILYQLKIIDDWQIEKKEQRKLLFVGAIVIYLLGLLFLKYFKMPDVIVISWLSYIISTILIYFINLYWKISIHLVGSSGAIFILYYLLNLPIYYMLIPAIIGWARLYLKKHTPAQVLGGYVFGLVIPLVIFKLFHI